MDADDLTLLADECCCLESSGRMVERRQHVWRVRKEHTSSLGLSIGKSRQSRDDISSYHPVIDIKSKMLFLSIEQQVNHDTIHEADSVDSWNKLWKNNFFGSEIH